jgi:MFS transporter, ACS family, D-galactonate transporter
VYAAGFLVWSVATAVTGIASSFMEILLLRLLLGAGESVAYPAYSKIIATTFPEQLRGTANGLIDAGSKIGPALGVYVGIQIVQDYSWRYMFLAIGGLSLIWLLPWALTVPKLPKAKQREEDLWSPSYRQLIVNRRVWGTVLGLFGANYMWYMFLTWLPYYFERERHFSKGMLAVASSLPFFAVAIASFCFGLLADWVIRRGYPAGTVRQWFVTVGLIGCCLFTIPAVLVGDQWLSTILMAVSCVFMAGFSSNHWALSQTLAGPEGAAKWTGFENCLGNFAGVIAPWLTGLVLDETHSFVIAFLVSCVVCLGGALGYSVVVGRPLRVQWRSQPALEPTPVGD